MLRNEFQEILIHTGQRHENTDTEEKLDGIFSAMEALDASTIYPVITTEQSVCARQRDILSKLNREVMFDPAYRLFGDGHSAEMIVGKIKEYFA